MPNEQDQQVNVFRKWLSQTAQGGPKWGKSAQLSGPFLNKLSKEELFDTYHGHTKHCLACQGALKNVLRLRSLSLIFALVSALTFTKKIQQFVSVTIFCTIAYLLDKFKNFFYKYDFHHQNNN